MLVAAGAVTALLGALDGPDIVATSAAVTKMHARLTAVEDSLVLLRSALADAQDDAGDSSAVAVASSAKAAPKSRPLLARLRDIVTTDGDEAGAVATSGISADGLPVIGMISSSFSAGRRHPVLHIIRPHLGVDVSAPRGTRITAPAAGTVTFVGRKFALGLLIEIEHPNGVVTRYAHCRSATVKAGQAVVRGTALGTVGSSGLTTGPHLHYEVMVNGQQVDPVGYRFVAADTGVAPVQGGVAPLQP